MAPAGFAEVLFEEDGADVVAAEAEAHLEDLEALGGPGALEVVDVVEVEAADGEGGEVLDCGGLGDVGADAGAAGLGGQRGEGGEAAGLFLQGAEDFEVVDALGDGFADAEDHGGGGAQAELVGGAVDADPVCGGAFVGGGALADFVVEDDGGCRRWSRGRRRGGGRWCRGERGLRSSGEGDDLGGGEAVELDFGEALLDAGEEGLVVVEGDGLARDGAEEEAGGAHVYGLAGAGVGGVEVGGRSSRGGGRWCR